jgi:hypothetical protein
MKAMAPENDEILGSLQSTVADMQRWILQAALNNRISNDKRSDFSNSARRICELVGKFKND